MLITSENERLQKDSNFTRERLRELEGSSSEKLSLEVQVRNYKI